MSTVLRAILADVIHFALPRAEGEERLRELEELTQTYGGIAVVKVLQRRAQPDPRTYLGKGKAAELAAEAPLLGAELLIINDILSPQQVFRLQEMMPKGVKVWDRIDLILHIFDRHARSAEAKLEIALARERHTGPRMFNLGAQLGRQRGGTGTRGGSGEGNTEAMRRHHKEQERRLVDRLAACERTRALQRARRTREGFRSVALVGYTNAGKTSLLNCLTGRREYAADALFATLDTRVGELFLPDAPFRVLLSDTIGFIRELPPSLIRAFQATLSEAVHADLLFHVVDAADPRRQEKIAVVEDVLARLGLADRPCLQIFTKCDLLPPQAVLPPGVVRVSSITGEGVAQLCAAATAALSPGKTSADGVQ